MTTAELIRKKREGQSLSENEFHELITGYVKGSVPDYQMSAFLMACYFRGMSNQETLTLTRLMLQSGEIIDLSTVPGIKVDKHSTGGVGDKVSLILAPIVASCGVPVPMISGRGLGHTGGTLDKLESIPGIRTNLSVAEYKTIMLDIGVVMIGQTNEIAPADKKMYALRDVTATVECIPLIAGSIMSKKLAEGIDGLVLDIKTGRGAFMRTRERAQELARTLVNIGTEFGKETIGFVTSMDQPLGVAIGNWLEVVESIECLRNQRGSNDGSSDLMEVTHLLSGTMIMLGGKATSIEEGILKSKHAIQTGKAYEKFLQMVQAQGGDVDAVRGLGAGLPPPKFASDIVAETSGFVGVIDSFELGLSSIELGAGRERMDDVIDPQAGIRLMKKVGEKVKAGETVARLFTDREHAVGPTKARVEKAFQIVDTPQTRIPMVLDVVDKNGVRPWES
jgi:pyrimidine-nucleoside phosphorylase